MYNDSQAAPALDCDHATTMRAPPRTMVSADSGSPATPHLNPLQASLEGLAALMQAKGVALLSRSTDDAAVRTILATGETIASAEGAIPDDHEPFVALREIRWRDRGVDTLAVVKLIERRDVCIWAAIAFAADRTAIDHALGDEMPTFVTLLVSHASTLLALAEARSRADAVTQALDQHHCGLFILRRDHTLLHANARAQAMLGHNAGLKLSRGKLRPLGYKEAVRFETAIDHVVDSQQATASERSRAMLLLLPSHGSKLLAVTIAPVGRDALQIVSNEAAVLVSIEPADDRLDHGVEAICQAYRLSPVEIQLVCHLCGGLSVADAAGRMRVKVDTARAYLKQVFAKTGTHRQVALLQLVAGHQRAFHGDHLFGAI